MSASPARRDDAAGFTLIEALVALAILAVSAISLLTATEAYVSRIGGVELRALAQLAAENHLAEMEIGTAGAEGRAELLGRRFEIAATLSPTSDPDLSRVDLAVSEPESGARFGGFTGFLDTGFLDTGLPDTGFLDTGLPDTGLPDTGSLDTGSLDTGGRRP